MPLIGSTPACGSGSAAEAALLRAGGCGRPPPATAGSAQNGEMEPEPMHTFSAVIERCPETGLLVGYVPGFPGAHSQGESLDELQANLQEVIAMLLEDGEPALDSDFVGLQQISVPT